MWMYVYVCGWMYVRVPAFTLRRLIHLAFTKFAMPCVFPPSLPPSLPPARVCVCVCSLNYVYVCVVCIVGGGDAYMHVGRWRGSRGVKEGKEEVEEVEEVVVVVRMERA